MESYTPTFIIFSGKTKPLTSIRKTLIRALLYIAVINDAYAELTTEQEAAKTRGVTLYNQYKATSATPFLSIAAEAGDHEAQYYLGESLRRKNHYMNPEARKWYEASAAQGDLYAMIQLGRSEKDLCQISNDCPSDQKQPIEWLNQAQHLAKPKAEQGDAEAMFIMYQLTIDQGWLEKSANAGDAVAQYWMAIGEQEGNGVFLLPWKRSESITKWLKASSEGGYPKAMMAYVAVLYKEGDMEGVRHWLEEAAKTGDQNAVSTYGAYLTHTPDKVGYPLDLVKGYGLVSLLKELDGGGSARDYLEVKLPEIEEKMTPEQISKANEFAKKWKLTHPPLSFFPEKLSH
ncbi:tetratricopeptide repeat protein [Pseudomonas sp. TH31]|uniref:tetratricopeptide repeat protein n=1 Tax=Pseudomonas sp. TH31 TaxID=2796396 RepID=UPI001F5B367C|nr:sel1 repeat family protein [Pseudomonas sp. TH31]